MNNIRIGDEWFEVPPGYLKAEADYTHVETTMFNLAQAGPVKEYTRKQVLDKRIEFHKKVQSGEITIPEPLPPKVSWFTKLVRCLTS